MTTYLYVVSIPIIRKISDFSCSCNKYIFVLYGEVKEHTSPNGPGIEWTWIAVAHDYADKEVREYLYFVYLSHQSLATAIVIVRLSSVLNSLYTFDSIYLYKRTSVNINSAITQQIYYYWHNISNKAWTLFVVYTVLKSWEVVARSAIVRQSGFTSSCLVHEQEAAPLCEKAVSYFPLY